MCQTNNTKCCGQWATTHIITLSSTSDGMLRHCLHHLRFVSTAALHYFMYQTANGTAKQTQMKRLHYAAQHPRKQRMLPAVEACTLQNFHARQHMIEEHTEVRQHA
jgi:hypothetical protein